MDNEATEKRLFGTDGIRGKVGQFPITPDFILRVGWALGQVLSARSGERRPKVIIGKDTRSSGYFIESALEAGLSAAGVGVVLLGPMPTPGIAFFTQHLDADAGVVISASHNHYYDNGLKFFSNDGKKFSDELELAIERACQEPMTVVEANKLGKAVRYENAAEDYIEFCAQTVKGQSFAGLTCVLDCAHGAAYHVAPVILAKLGIHVKTLGVSPNGVNINHRCGSTSPQALQRAVIAEQADLGIALDGDGDRVIFVDHQGRIADGDELLYVLAKHRQQTGTLQGGVVGTLMTNYGLELMFKKQNIPFVRSAVGDRYVLQVLEEQGWELGGEASGHLLALDKTTTGDGIVSALLVLQALAGLQQKLAAICDEWERLPQSLVNVTLPFRCDPLSFAPIQAIVEQAESTLAGKGRVLLRCSGTEPLVRVMVEGHDATKVETLAYEIASVVEQTLANLQHTEHV